MKPGLPPRQAQVAELVRRGLPNKVIATQTGLAYGTVCFYIKLAASKIPGNAPPRQKLTLWFLDVVDDT